MMLRIVSYLIITGCIVIALLIHTPLSDVDAISYTKNALYFLQQGHFRDAAGGDYSFAFRPYGQSALIALIYGIFGYNPYYVIAVQVLLFLSMFYILILIIKQIDNNAENCFMILFPSYFLFYKYIVDLHSEISSLFFVALSLYYFSLFVADRKLKYLFLNGFFLGISAIFKTYIFYFIIPLSLYYLFYSYKSDNPFPKKSVPFVFMSFVLACSPILYKNYTELGVFDRLTTYGGYNLYLGNFAISKGDWKTPVHSTHYAEINEKITEISQNLNELERDNALKKEALIIIKNNFSSFVKKCIFQAGILLSWSGYEEFFFKARYHLLQYVLYVMLAFYGLLSFPREYFHLRNMIVIHISYCLFLFSITFAHPRLKDSMALFIVILASFGAAGIYARLKAYLEKRYV